MASKAFSNNAIGPPEDAFLNTPSTKYPAVANRIAHFCLCQSNHSWISNWDGCGLPSSGRDQSLANNQRVKKAGSGTETKRSAVRRHCV